MSSSSQLSPRSAGGSQPVKKDSRSRSLPTLPTLRSLSFCRSKAY